MSAKFATSGQSPGSVCLMASVRMPDTDRRGSDIRYRGRSSPTYCFAASAFTYNLLVRHERSHSPSLAFIEPVARDAPKMVVISTGISEVAFLLGLVIFFSDTEHGESPSQFTRALGLPIHEKPSAGSGMIPVSRQPIAMSAAVSLRIRLPI